MLSRKYQRRVPHTKVRHLVVLRVAIRYLFFFAGEDEVRMIADFLELDIVDIVFGWKRFS